jgi:hypothetical protein
VAPLPGFCRSAGCRSAVWRSLSQDTKLGLRRVTWGISFRALSAAAVGSKFVAYLALDTVEDAARANGVLKKLS